MAVGVAAGFQLGLESARRRRVEEKDRALALEDRARQHAREDMQTQAAELSLARMRRADAREPEELARQHEREDFDLARARTAAGRQDDEYDFQQQQRRQQLQQEGVVDLVHALRSGVDPAFALSQFNSSGSWKIDPRTFRYDPTTGGMEFVDSDGDRFEGQLEQLEAAVGAPASLAQPPESRTLMRDGQRVTQEWNRGASQWRDIASSPQFSERVASADVLVPLARKLAAGEQLTPGEQAAADLLQRTDMLDRVISQAFGGGSVPTGARTGSPSSTDDETAIVVQEALDAIGQGADPQAVKDRLIELGIDPALLGL